jgi:hypothetical protein
LAVPTAAGIAALIAVGQALRLLFLSPWLRGVAEPLLTHHGIRPCGDQDRTIAWTTVAAIGVIHTPLGGRRLRLTMQGTKTVLARPSGAVWLPDPVFEQDAANAHVFAARHQVAAAWMRRRVDGHWPRLDTPGPCPDRRRCAKVYHCKVTEDRCSCCGLEFGPGPVDRAWTPLPLGGPGPAPARGGSDGARLYPTPARCCAARSGTAGSGNTSTPLARSSTPTRRTGTAPLNSR